MQIDREALARRIKEIADFTPMDEDDYDTLIDAANALTATTVGGDEVPVETSRNHYYAVEVFVPSDVTISDDRIRWYFDHAIRGYWRKFATESDPIRGMSRCSVVAKKVPFKRAAAPPPPSQNGGAPFVRQYEDELVGTPCERCQGNGEIVTDWDRYMHAHDGDVGDEAVAECPDCNGTGRVSQDGAREGGVCGACGQPWTGEKCGQALNDWPHPVCYPAPPAPDEAVERLSEAVQRDTIYRHVSTIPGVAKTMVKSLHAAGFEIVRSRSAGGAA